MSSAGDKLAASASAGASASAPKSPVASSNDLAPSREPTSLKRGREGSVDLLASEVPSITPIVAKKNRIEDETTANSEDEENTPVEAEADAEAPPAVQAKEGRNVGEVRKKVEEMTWKEGEGKSVKGQNASEDDSDDVQATDDNEQTLKRKADTENGTASDEKKRKSTSPPPADTEPAPEPPKKPQATFGAFSAKASPFASANSASPFGAAASSASPFAAKASDAKPSAFSGFGSYSTAFSAFSKKPEVEEDGKAGPSSFGDILKERGEEEEEKKVLLDKQEVLTGEEDEITVYQTRVKLFALNGDGGWRERGVGALKLNKKRDGSGGARMVMRAEGVLRVILNASLYVGMPCLEDGKHVRTTVFEDRERTSLTIRTANLKTASELASAIHDHIPLESSKPPSSGAPSASPVAAKGEESDTSDKADSAAPEDELSAGGEGEEDA